MARTEMHLHLKMIECGNLQGPTDVVSIATDLPKHGLFPAQGSGMDLTIVDAIPAFVRSKARVYDRGVMGNWFVAFPVVVQWNGHLICTFDCGDSPDRISHCELGGLIDREDTAEIVPFSKALLSFGFDCYSKLKPAMGYIDEAFSNQTMTAHVKKARIVSIGWANFFGPPYVEKYGRDFLMHLPGYRTQELSDGGVFHQLARTFLSDDQKAARAIRQEVVDYCRNVGLKVTCHAPYYFPGAKVSGQSSAGGVMTDDEVRDYMRCILATTLVLEDDTRVKVVRVPWESLTTRQFWIAIEEVRNAVLQEVKAHRGSRIRLEFNRITDELDRALAELVGRDNPDVEIAEVEMDNEDNSD